MNEKQENTKLQHKSMIAGSAEQHVKHEFDLRSQQVGLFDQDQNEAKQTVLEEQ